MKRAILAALAALLLLVSPVSADSATLSVTSVEMSCDAPIANRGCITFQSEADAPNGGPNRHVVEVRIYADWACAISTNCLAASGTAEVDKDGVATFLFRNGTHGSGQPYSQSFSAYVAHYGSRLSPVSPVVTGSIP